MQFDNWQFMMYVASTKSIAIIRHVREESIERSIWSM